MISEKTKINFKLLLVIISSWMAFYSMIFLYEYISIKIRYPDLFDDLDIASDFLINMGSVFVAGLIGGSILSFGIRKKSQNHPFYYGIMLTAVLFLIVYGIISAGTSFIVYSIQLGKNPFETEVLTNVIQNVTSPYQLKNVLIWFFVLVTTQFLVQINDKFGPGNLWKFIRGRYYNPKEELRVFMFLDIKSSTTIAEKLGHKQYFLFLNDFFAEITDPIIDRQGEIYQYVGDEIVISWSIKRASKNLNCLHCFFDIKETILKRDSFFNDKYGFSPEFKAGIHFGPVTVGEIGIFKRDIIFSGDVLNTTARIQALCNEREKDILISENTLSIFDKVEPFKLTYLDKIILKGKQQGINLATLQLIKD